MTEWDFLSRLFIVCWRHHWVCSAIHKEDVVTLTEYLDQQAASAELQLGFPILSLAGSDSHIKILDKWIHNCNTAHNCYPSKDTFLPTRVLDVVDKDATFVRLTCDIGNQTRPGRYIALSHRWGSDETLRTTQENKERFQDRINIFDLPKTFRDAVYVTRKLGIQYLWIDSLCIVQDDAEDWDTESKLMEQVFSSAYVTIAASCASGTDDGFLKSRPPRQCVTLKKDNGAEYYICDTIDNFAGDVDQGELNKRGWVLQERALSRRTIYFTEKQSYWECGGGVRCETLTKMKK